MNVCCEAIEISKNIYWVGAIDWAIRDFHGYATERGTTYNAYLIIDEKITLIDTVKHPFKDEMLARISSVIEPEKIDYIISNHSELDHSGCLPQIIEQVKPAKVFASAAGEKALNSHFNLNCTITTVKTGEELSLGKNTISFMETKMLHWPDSMFSYLKEEQILFSQDAFGMHLACSKLFVSQNDWPTVKVEAAKYFANILMIFAPQLLKLLDKIAAMEMPIKMIASDHGPIWNNKIDWIIESYRRWAEQKPTNKAVIIYDTMWQSTEKMARSIADGLRTTGTEIEVLPLKESYRSNVATAVLEAGALLVGSPTLNNNAFPRTMDTMFYLKGLRPKNLIGTSFGSYGWSGEAVPQLSEFLKNMNIELISDGLKVRYVPSEQDLKECFELGRLTGSTLQQGCKEK